MLTTIAVVPSTPLLVPQLATGAAAETADLRAAAVRAAAALPARWVAVGVAAVAETVAPGAVGTFAGYGVDVPVRLSATDRDATAPTRQLPLCALITGWLRCQAGGATARVDALPADLDAAAAVAAGATLRADLDATRDDVGVLIVADGHTTLTPSAPGGYRPESAAAQQDLDDALAAADAAALARVSPAVTGRVGYQALAGLLGTAPHAMTELYRGQPYGVGYFVGVAVPVPPAGEPGP